MKNVKNLVEKVRVEESKFFGIRVYFEMKPSIDDEWIDWDGDYIKADASPVFNSLDGIYPEDIENGRRFNLSILKDLTCLSKSEILKELKTLEEIWIEKFRDIKGSLDIELTAFEAEVGGEC